MRKFIASLLLTGALASSVAAPAFAGTDFCLTDPPVTLDHSTVDIGLYTPDRALLSDISGTIQIKLHVRPDSVVTTDATAWQQRFPTEITVVKDLRRAVKSGQEPLEIEAVVPTDQGGERFYIQVQLPDGSIRTSETSTSATNKLTVEVPE